MCIAHIWCAAYFQVRKANPNDQALKGKTKGMSGYEI